MKKKVEILVYHLGYGGIEQAVSALTHLLHDDVELSIVSFYKLYDTPVFPLANFIPITYLYQTDVPLKVKKYNQLFRQGKIMKLFSSVFQDYFKGFHFITFFHDLLYSFDIYFMKGRFRKLKKHLKKSNADVYISTRFEISNILSKYGNPASFKIGWEHNHHHGNLEYKKRVIEFSKNLNRLVLVSRNLTNDYRKEFENSQCKCVYIPNVLNYDLPFVSDYQEKRILLVGRLEQEKGIFDAIDVMKRLQERQVFFHLDIVGDGPLLESLMKHVQDKNLSNYITFHGFQNHTYIEQLYRHASLYLMTSFTESFGLVLIEAMNAGLPCVAFDSAEGAQELLFNDSNGYLIQNRNLDEMADKISYLLMNMEVIMRLGKNAKEFSKNFLPSSVKAMWMNVLEDQS